MNSETRLIANGSEYRDEIKVGAFLYYAERKLRAMKLCFVVIATLALAIAHSLHVNCQAGLEGMKEAAQPKSFNVICPVNLQIGPLYVPDGWQSMGSLARPILGITVDAQTQMVLCQYGSKDNMFSTYYIGQKIRAGYDCKLPSPTNFYAVCTKKIQARPGER
jgi:hypothetical protein